MVLRFLCFYLYSTHGQEKMFMGINIKMSLMPKGINKIIYNPRVLVNTLTLVPWGYYFFPVAPCSFDVCCNNGIGFLLVWKTLNLPAIKRLKTLPYSSPDPPQYYP